jgi:hypothetical protein
MRGDGLTIAIPLAAALSLARAELCGVGKAPPRPYHGDSLVPFLVGGGAAEAAAAAWAQRCMVTDTQRVPRPDVKLAQGDAVIRRC